MEINIEALSLSIVREFLSRKKCKDALQKMDEEWPRDEKSISNRTKLAQALSVESWMNNNKLHPPKFKTMLEVILYNVCAINKKKCQSTDSVVTDNYSDTKPKVIQSRPFTADSSTTSRVSKLCLSKDTQLVQVEDLDDFNMDELKAPLSINKPSRINREHTAYDQFEMQQPDFLTTTNDFKNTRLNLNDRQEITDTAETFTKTEKRKSDFINESMLSAERQRPKSTSVFEGHSIGSKDFSQEQGNVQYSRNTKHSSINSHNNFMGNELQQEIQAVTEGYTMKHSKSKFQSTRQIENAAVTSKFEYETAKNLRMLIFGSTKHGFPMEWSDQSFTFCDCTDRPEMLRFGITQKRGGPCGILAAVQATVLKQILFGNSTPSLSPSYLNVSSAVRTNALVEAITNIIWNAGNKTNASLLVLSPRKQFTVLPHEYRCDGVTESSVLFNFTIKSELQSAVKKHIRSYEYGKGSCILLLYSVILSRGIDAVRADLDEPSGKLMGAHGYCTQEMINLILTGCATSNAFNNIIKLDQMTLRGVSAQSDIGLLSLFEHYASCKVGSFYKTPKYPIWLICSESHFTVLFGLDMNIVSEYKPPGVFDLYYYDGLANQDEVIVLTIDTTTTADESSLTGDLVPPLEHCIRTKWPKVKVDWNETDPIL